MIIRKAKMNDLDEITAVEKICFPPSEAATRESFEKRLEAFADSFLIAEEDGKIVGFVNGCITDEKVISDEMFVDTTLHNPNGGYQAIFGLVVIPGYRGKGTAKELMNELIGRTKACGKKGLILTCKEHLTGFYSAFGYKNLGVSGSNHGGAVWYDMILEF